MPNIIYVLTNEAMPGLVKIGFTEDSVVNRMRQLTAHAGVPLPFECYYAAEVDDTTRVERILHQLFSEARVNPKREFFRQLGELLRDRQYWALFIIREDYLAPFDPYAPLVPTQFKNRFRLDLLSLDNASKAI